MKYVVLDINGVIADVRRREAPAVSDLKPDVVLPNGQKVFVHPLAHFFLGWLTDFREVEIVTYTSRLRRNARPIEQLFDNVHSHGSNPVRLYAPVARLYGEDCRPPKPGATQQNRFHPVKTVDAVVRALQDAHKELPTSDSDTSEEEYIDEADIIFVDDHPDRIDSGNAQVIYAKSFDANDSAHTVNNLSQTARDIRSKILHS